jgi:hypothetical protein
MPPLPSETIRPLDEPTTATVRPQARIPSQLETKIPSCLVVLLGINKNAYWWPRVLLSSWRMGEAESTSNKQFISQRKQEVKGRAGNVGREGQGRYMKSASLVTTILSSCFSSTLIRSLWYPVSRSSQLLLLLHQNTPRYLQVFTQQTTHSLVITVTLSSNTFAQSHTKLFLAQRHDACFSSHPSLACFYLGQRDLVVGWRRQDNLY